MYAHWINTVASYPSEVMYHLILIGHLEAAGSTAKCSTMFSNQSLCVSAFCGDEQMVHNGINRPFLLGNSCLLWLKIMLMSVMRLNKNWLAEKTAVNKSNTCFQLLTLQIVSIFIVNIRTFVHFLFSFESFIQIEVVVCSVPATSSQYIT